jgi:hypothetical protein
MSKCNNCGYCQEHCQCDWECGKCEPTEEDIDIQECGTDIDDDLPEIEDKEKEVEDNSDIIYCYE